MANNYLKEKAEKKKSAIKALWLLLIFLFIVISIIVRISLTGSLKSAFYTGLPSSDDAYAVAEDYVRPTLKSTSADFSDSKYQFGKTSDSVYVIKSSVESRDKNDEKVTVEFKIILKYNGGPAATKKSWSLITLDEF